MSRPRDRVAALVRHSSPKVGRLSQLRLDVNENTVGFPPIVIQQMLGDITPAFLAAYPETDGLYGKIAQRHGVTSEEVLVTAGSELAIRYLFETYLEPGADLLILDPSFAMLEVYGRLYGANVVPVPFDEQFHMSLERVLEHLSPATRVAAIANPNNPTGTVFTEADLLAIVERAAAVDCLVLVDEAYFYFYKQTMIPHVCRFANLVVTRTFSKACGLASIRLGYMIGPPDVIRDVQKVQPIDHVNSFAAKLGEYLLDHEELVWDYARQVERGKRYVLRELRSLGLAVVDGHANFVLIDFGPERKRLIAALRAKGILVGASLRLAFSNSYIRITVGPEQQMRVFVEALRQCLSPLQTASGGQS